MLVHHEFAVVFGGRAVERTLVIPILVRGGLLPQGLLERGHPRRLGEDDRGVAIVYDRRMQQPTVANQMLLAGQALPRADAPARVPVAIDCTMLMACPSTMPRAAMLASAGDICIGAFMSVAPGRVVR